MRLRRRGRERGAIIPIVAILLSLLVTIASFAVDLGQLRVGRRDMQALADVVALDLARQVDGRNAATILSDPLWTSGRDQSIQRNGGTFGSAPVVTAEVGIFDPVAGFSAVTGSLVPNAVRVTADTTINFSFRPGSGVVSRSSVAQTAATACFGVGSFAARIRGDGSTGATLSGSVNTPLLTTTINLLTQVNSGYNVSALGYSGLLDAGVSIAQLAAQLGVGSPDQLAGTTTTVGSFYAAVARVLQAGGNTADAQVLQTLSTNLGSAGSIQLGSILAASQGAATDATLNVFDLVTASALALNGSNLLSVPGVGVTLGSLGNVQLKLKLIEKPQTACTRVNDLNGASTSQLDATATAQLLALPTIAPLGPLLSVSAGPTGGLGVDATLSLAPATARLTAVTCASAANPAQSLTLAVQSGLLSSVAHVPLTLKVTALGINLTVNVVYTVTSTAAQRATSTTLTIPPQAFDTLYPSTGSTPFALTNTSVTYTTSVQAGGTGLGLINLDLLALNTGSLVLPGIINDLNSSLVTPLTGLLGVEIGGADVFATSSGKPNCLVPALRQ